MILIFIAIFVSVCYNMRRKIIARNPSRRDQEEKKISNTISEPPKDICAHNKAAYNYIYI